MKFKPHQKELLIAVKKGNRNSIVFGWVHKDTGVFKACVRKTKQSPIKLKREGHYVEVIERESK